MKATTQPAGVDEGPDSFAPLESCHRETLRMLGELSRDHIALEESVIYPQARIRMLEASRRDMRRVMAARR